jgi:hypothetical protein
MKKWFTRLGILFGGIVGLILVVPFFIQVDRYRPQIEQAVNQKIRGHLELGQLSLSLWGHLWVEVNGLKLQDSSQAEVIRVQHAYFELPFSTVFSGSPRLTFKMDSPEVHLSRDQQGHMNLMTLASPGEFSKTLSQKDPGQLSSAGQKQTQNVSDPSADQKSGPALPAILINSRLGFELKNALLTYEDRRSALKTEIKDFNLKLEDLSMSHPVRLEIWSDLNTRVGKTLALQGPIRLEGKAQPKFSGQSFQDLSLEASLTADDVQVQVPGTFEKKKGVEARSQISLKLSPDQVQVQQFKTTFLNAELTVQGKVSGVESQQGPTLDLDLATNEVQFAPWSALVPSLAQFELGGAAKFTAKVKGTANQPNYEAQIQVKELTAKASMLKAQPHWNAEVHVKTDQIDSIRLTMSAPGNQAELKGSLISFKKPNLTFQLVAEQMDLDQLVDFKSMSSSTKPGVAASAEKESSESSSESREKSQNKKGADTNYDSQVAELRKNPVLGDWTGRFAVKLGKLKANEIQLSQMSCQLNFKNWVTSLEDCGLKVFQGEIRSKFQLNLAATPPTYQGTLDVKGLDFAEAGAHSSPMFKDTLRGRGHFKMDLQGASFNAESAKSNLRSKGSFKVQPAEFSTLNVMKMVKDSVDQALNRISDQVPVLKGKGIGALPSHSSEYEEISSDFSIQNAVFSAPNFVAKAKPGRGVDLKGKTEVGIKDYHLDAFWELTDTYNLTHLRDISVEQNGIQVDHILADGNAPVHFPFHVSCTLTAPCYSSTEVPEALGKVALGNISKALSSRAKSELVKKASEMLNQVAPGIPAGLQNQLKGLFR